jgi:O-antigen ligase/tetratricopeptide (TPR) repeat protein
MSGSTSSLFAALSRLSLIVTLVAAPWPFGGYPLAWQPPIFAGILASLVCWWVAVLTRPTSHPDGGTILVDSLLPPVLLIVLGAFQLIPFANVPDVPAHAVLADVARPEIEASTIQAPQPITVAPSLTRVTAARLVFGLCAAFLGIQLFRDAGTRMWIYVPIALNAAAIAAFGIWQGAHWEEWKGMLFGTVPMRQGGQPFGPFVNRNNAAGMLNLGAAAAAAWAFLAAAPRFGRSFRRTTDDAVSLRGGGPDEESRPGLILSVIVLVAVCAGVLAALSRGGILAFGAAVVAALLVLMQSRRSRLAISVEFVVQPQVALTIGWFGFGKEIRTRFRELTSYTAKEGRIPHWTETMGAVKDAPWLGQGMGAYRYIHRPYQRTPNDRWFVNADNQFFELLVENGCVGLGLIVITIGLLFIDVRRLLESRAPWEQRDAALVGAIVLTSQSVQGLTDFGITLPANMLTAATLVGVVAGTAARSLPFNLVPSLSSPMVFRPRTAIPIGLVLVAAAGLGWREVTLAASADATIEALGALDTPDAVTPPLVDPLVTRVQDAVARRPDDAELQRALGDLLIFRFRGGVLDALKKDSNVASRKEEELWAGTGLERLLTQSLQLGDEAAQRNFAETLRQADPSGSLDDAKVAYQSAVASCRWVTSAAERDAMLQVIADQDLNAARRSIALAAVGDPADGGRLILLGAIARELGADDLALGIFKQAGGVAPQQIATLFKVGGEWLLAPERLEAVLPRDLEALLTFAESADGMGVAVRVSKVAEDVLEQGGEEASSRAGQMARIQRLRGETETALGLFQKAAAEEPLAWRWRVYAAETKFDLGRREEAVRDLEDAVKEFPRQSAIVGKLVNLRERALAPSP